MNYVIDMFPCIGTTEYENAVEKGNMGEAQMKGVPKGAPFLLPGKEGRDMAADTSFDYYSHHS